MSSITERRSLGSVGVVILSVLLLWGIVNMTVGHADAQTVNIPGTVDDGDRLRGEVAVAQGTVNQSGGSIWAEFLISNTGLYNLSGGGITSGLEFINNGTFNQSGGTTTVLGPGQWVWGLQNTGTYNLSGGTLTASLSNGGTFNYSGGELTPASYSMPLTNDGTFNLSGSGTRTVDGNVVNNGTFKTTHTTAAYTGTFTNNGAYISDPATQYFTNLVIGQNGYLVGQNGDKFYISGDFVNKSTMNTAWNTKQASLTFLQGANSIHQLYLMGADYGATMSAYADNFSWGTLDLTGEDLNLQDGNTVPGGALYLRDITGLELSGNLISNIFGMDGLDIYYMANLPGNGYLGGLPYDLSGGGHLIPVGGTAVPEPTTLLLVGSALIGLVGCRRKFKGLNV